MKRFCVNTLNFLKFIDVYLPVFIIVALLFAGIFFENTYSGDQIIHYAPIAFAYWIVLFAPIYWVLLFIQKIMTLIWKNKEEYFNAFEFLI